MESESSVMLESSGEESMLIETVKNIVTDNSRNDLESEEEGYFVVTDVQSDVQNEQSNVMVVNEESTINQSEDRTSWSNLCRICANVNDHLIPIFDGEGLQHELCNKIHKYLPINVSENDTLPLQLCYHCAATLLAWHELTEGCLNAERRLLEIQDSLQEKNQYFNTSSSDGLEASTQDTTPISNKGESLSQQQSAVKDETCGESTVNDSDRWNTTEPESVVQVPTTEIERTIDEDVDYIECMQCEIVFTDMKCLLSHIRVDHDIQVHYCEYCKLVYRGQKEDFKEHILIHKNGCEVMKEVHLVQENQIFECDNHIQSDTVKSKEPVDDVLYTCHFCDKTYAKKTELKKHITRHSESKPPENRDETELLNKARRINDDRVCYKCDTCEKLMFTKRGFLRHMRVHTGKRPCKCDLCGKCYRIEQDLARHVRDVHEGVKKYVCDICGRPFANKGARNDHRRIHTGERPYACEYCPKTFRTLNSIYIHNRVHTDYKPHKCSFCGKNFRSRQRLTHHETTHTGAKPFPCEICGKTFSVKGEVVRHRATHNKEKPFDCKVCSMKFGQKRYLRTHIKLQHKDVSSVLLSELLENRN